MLETFESFFRSITGTGLLVFLSLLSFLFFSGLMIREILKEKSPRWPLLLILLAGLALRIYWIQLTQPVPNSDFAVYWDSANVIHQGDNSFTALDRHAGSILFYVFAFSLFGTSMAVGWGVNLFFSTILLLAVYKLCTEFFGRLAALLAAALAAILPQFVTYTALMATEIHAIAFTLVILWAVLYSKNVERNRVAYWAGLGLMMYGGVMVRATHLLLLGVIPVVMLVMRRRRLKEVVPGLVAMLVTAGVLLSTWVYHQYLLTGVPKLFFTEYMLAFSSQYDNEGGVSGTGSLPYYAKAARLMDGSIAGEVRARKVIEAEAWKIIRQDPIRYLKFGFVRMKNSLWYARTGILWTIRDSRIFKPDAKLTRRLSEISTHSWRLLMILSLLGMLAAFRKRPSREASEGHLVIVLFLGIWLVAQYLTATGTDRYGLQVAPFVLIYSAGCLSMLWHWIKATLLSGRSRNLPVSEGQI